MELIEEGYEDLVENSIDTQQKLSYKENKKKDAFALRFIHAAVSKIIFPRVYGFRNSKEAWDTLKICF